MNKLLLVLVFILAPMINCFAVEVDGICYELDPNNNTASVTSNPNFYVGEIMIPNTINLNGITYSVTSIAPFAFVDSYELTSVVIPDNVQSISDHAFYCCIHLTSVTIGKGVSYIGESAFGGCDELTSVYISDLEKWCVINHMPEGNGSYFGENPLSLAKHFYLNGEDVKDLIIPEGISSISNGAFYCFSGFTSLSLPESLISIGKCSFYACEGLTTLVIPNSVTTIGDEAFRGCEGLLSVTIGSNVNFIGNGAFSEDWRLYSIVIPNSVTFIGNCAFSAPNLRDVYCYAEKLPETDINAFFEYDRRIYTGTLHVPAVSVEAYKTTEPWKYFENIVPLSDTDPHPTSVNTKLCSLKDNGKIYNLNGVHGKPTGKGLYIINGKKTIGR